MAVTSRPLADHQQPPVGAKRRQPVPTAYGLTRPRRMHPILLWLATACLVIGRTLLRPRVQRVIFNVIFVIAAAVVVIALIQQVVAWGTRTIDDLRYGTPRVHRVSGWVGHGEQTGHQTQLMALNLNRHVVVYEIPGGDAEQTRVLTGPYLFGAGEDLTPVTLELRYVDADTHIDLVITAKQEQVIYRNHDGREFRLLTDAERAAVVGVGQ